MLWFLLSMGDTIISSSTGWTNWANWIGINQLITLFWESGIDIVKPKSAMLSSYFVVIVDVLETVGLWVTGTRRAAFPVNLNLQIRFFHLRNVRLAISGGFAFVHYRRHESTLVRVSFRFRKFRKFRNFFRFSVFRRRRQLEISFFETEERRFGRTRGRRRKRRISFVRFELYFDQRKGRIGQVGYERVELFDVPLEGLDEGRVVGRIRQYETPNFWVFEIRKILKRTHIFRRHQNDICW